MTTDTTVDVVASLGVLGGDEAPPADDGGLLALCLAVLTPGLALGLWLLATAARGGGWRAPRIVDAECCWSAARTADGDGGAL